MKKVLVAAVAALALAGISSPAFAQGGNWRGNADSTSVTSTTGVTGSGAATFGNGLASGSAFDSRLATNEGYADAFANRNNGNVQTGNMGSSEGASGSGGVSLGNGATVNAGAGVNQTWGAANANSRFRGWK